jgi:hypothetical protein
LERFSFPVVDSVLTLFELPVSRAGSDAVVEELVDSVELLLDEGGTDEELEVDGGTCDVVVGGGGT